MEQRAQSSRILASRILASRILAPWILTCLAVLATLGAAAPAAAQDKPRYGGELIFVVAAEPPSFDAHQEETFAMLHPGAPQYNTLLRVDPHESHRPQGHRHPPRAVAIPPRPPHETLKGPQGVEVHRRHHHDSRGREGPLRPIRCPP